MANNFNTLDVPQITAETPRTFLISRAVFDGAGSNIWETRVAGELGLYTNERAEGRAKAHDATSVAFKAKSHSGGDNTGVHIIEATLSDEANKVWWASANDYTPANIPNLGTNVSLGTPAAQYWNEARGITRLYGQLAFGAVINGGVTLFQLPVGSRPNAVNAPWVFAVRVVGGTALATVLTITSTGVASLGSTLPTGAGQTLNLDGITFVHD